MENGVALGGALEVRGVRRSDLCDRERIWKGGVRARKRDIPWPSGCGGSGISDPKKLNLSQR